MDVQPNTSDDKLDETIDETFPASDPPANTVEVGLRVGVPDLAAPEAEEREQHPADPGGRAR